MLLICLFSCKIYLKGVIIYIGKTKYKRWSIQQKNEIALLYLDGHMSCSQILKEFNISHKSILYDWVEQYRKYGTCVDNRGKCTKQQNPKKGRQKIVAYNISNFIDLKLVLDTVKLAIEKTPLNQRKNLVLHSDHGWHFTNWQYIKLLKENHIQHKNSLLCNLGNKFLHCLLFNLVRFNPTGYYRQFFLC